MILIGSRKKRQLTGFGLHEFSMKGLSEVSLIKGLRYT